MAASMRRISAKEMQELLEKMEKDDFLGYVMTVQDGDSAEQHQTIMLYKNLPGIQI